MSQDFPKPFRNFGGNKNVKVDLPNYEKKNWFKKCNARWYFKLLKTNLANLKTEVDKLYTDKLVPVPVDLSKLSDVIKNVKKTVYDKLVAKVNNIDTSDFLLQAKYNNDKTELEQNIPDVNNFVEKTKLTELGNKIPDISNLALKTALTVVEK